MLTPAVVPGSPAYVATATPVVSTVVVTQAPPMLQQEIVLVQPSPQHVWLAGYWTWRDARYQWMAGRWELPPSSSSVWVAPRWEQQGNAYKFTEGYWN
jgi:WXXGXW repeat (2 copies)